MWSSVNPNGQNVRLTKRDLEKYMGKRGVIKKITDKNNKVVYKESVNEGKWNPNKIKMHTNKAIGYLKQAQKFAKEGQKGAVWQRMGDARDELKIADKFLESVNEAWSKGGSSKDINNCIAIRKEYNDDMGTQSLKEYKTNKEL